MRRKKKEEEEEEEKKRRKEYTDEAEEFFLAPRAEFTARPQGLQPMKQPGVSVTEVSAILI